MQMMHASPARYFHASNLLSYASLLMALAAVTLTRDLGTPAAGALIAAAALADTFDGRFARRFARTAGQRAFGTQLDSLIDAVAFGAAPVAAVYAATAFDTIAGRTLWLAAGAFYGACAVTRLGCYNLEQTEQSSFVGLPAPVAALIISSALLTSPSSAVGGAALLALCGVGMVFPIRIPRPRGAALALFAAWPVVLILVHVL
jgi:phosphatidylserine synthase